MRWDDGPADPFLRGLRNGCILSVLIWGAIIALIYTGLHA